MSKKRVFISFDYDHDLSLKNLLLGQASYPDSPFEITDFSIKEQLTGDQLKKAKERIKRCDVVIVICGEYTDRASGVKKELSVTKCLTIPYFLLRGYLSSPCIKPISADDNDKMYEWTWGNLKALLNGVR